MSTSSNMSGNSTTALVLSSATVHPPVRPTSLNRNSNYWDTDSKITRIVFMILLGIAYGAFAASLELGWPAVALLTVVGVGFIPTIECIVYRKYRQNQGSSITSITPRAQPMTKEEALRLLNISADEENNRLFIDEQYHKLIEAVTPGRMRPMGQVGLGINQLLANIHEAHRMLTN